MKHLKKVLACILSAAMIMTAFAGLTFADEETHPGPHFIYSVSPAEVEVGDTVTLNVSSTAMTVETITGGFFYDTELLTLDTASLPESASLTGTGGAISLTVSENDNHNGVGFFYGGTSEVLYEANDDFLQVNFTATAAGTAVFTYYEDVDGPDEYYIEDVLEGPSVTITGSAAEEGYITYNGEKLYDSVIAGCIDAETGDALLTDVLAAANITPTGDCCYVFASADGYTATLDADYLEYMVLFDNDGVAGAPYDWRNSLKAEIADTIQGKWYKVTGLATIVTHDHAYDAETHLCTNLISVGKNTTEPCGEQDPEYVEPEEGYITYNGEKLYDSVIAGCLDENGDALLTDVLTAANIEPTGDCCYVFASADGYTATLDADYLEYMVLFDNDGVAGAPYSWRNSVTDTSIFTGGWYKVTGLATIETHDHAYDAETHLCTNLISVGKNTTEPCGAEEGYITYNGEKLYDSVIAGCLDENGDALLTDVLTAANIEPTGDCCYVFASADGYTATLDADYLEYMVLFDNDGVAGAPYDWRNSLKAEIADTIQGKWYKVTGLATIVTHDHAYDAETHLCTNLISVGKNTTEPCGEQDPEYVEPEEGYITYNGEKLYDSVIAGCLDENGDALLTDVLAAANITPAGDCCYVFTAADGYTATLDADILDQMVLFDNDGVAGAPYSWRNSVTDTSIFTGGWYKVTGLATIETHDHAYDAETHLCTNQISVSRGAYEDCGEQDPEYVEQLDGWIEDDQGNWRYYEDGTIVTGWIRPARAKYYLDESGIMVTGWREIEGEWYYFNTAGAMQTGWIRPGRVWYYLDESGIMVTGWREIEGEWYYFNTAGAMQTGWIKPARVWYYLDGSGRMVTGWREIEGEWYYFNTAGAMQTGWIRPARVWYYLDGSGRMVTGWREIEGEWYYFNTAGAMQTGWIRPARVWYYLDGSGRMVTGWQVIEGKRYYFNSNGALQMER